MKTTGYSHYFARKGYHVDAVELVESNIIEFTKKTLPTEKVSIHLSTEAERKAAIREALRVTKSGGKVFMAYILNEMTVINYFFRNGHINDAEERKMLLSANWRFYEHKRKHLSFYRIEDDEGYRKCPESWDKEYNEKYARLWQTMKSELRCKRRDE